jgi:hypothetical protein
MVLAHDIQICTVLSKHVKCSKRQQQLKEVHRDAKQFSYITSKNSKVSMAPLATVTKEIKNTHLHTKNNGS